MLEYLIKNATVVDGTGEPAYRASIGVEGDKIVAIIKEGELPEAKKVIDAEGQILTPGFIDIHSHVDASIAIFPDVDNNLMQGITTIVGGNCGLSIAPAYDKEFMDAYLKKNCLDKHLKVCWQSFGEWLDYLSGMPIGVNYVPLVGHNALRGSVLGMDHNRASTAEEIEKISGLLDEALDAGAFGMTYMVDPGQVGHHADDTEMKLLLKQLENRDSFVSAHTRHHQNQWPSDDGRNYYGVYVGEPGDVLCGRYHGFKEVLDLLKDTPNLTAAYSHLTNAFMTPMPHSQTMEDAMLDETLRVFVDEPAEQGYKIYFNVLTHEHSLACIRKTVSDLIPSLRYDAELSAYADEETLLNKLAGPAFREKMMTYMKSGKYKVGMLSPATDPYWSDCYKFVTAKDSSLVEKTLMQITKERVEGYTSTSLVYNDCYEVLFDLLQEDPELEWALICDKREYMAMKKFLGHPRGMPMTDGGSFPANSDKWLNTMGYGNPPQVYSAFIRYLVDISRDGGVISVEEAIRKATSLPAEVVGLKDRGCIAEGMYADLILMDWDKLGYTIDFHNPSKQPDGIRYVWVNGVPALENGKLTRANAGQVLRKTQQNG